jgi:hypothetical protein
MIERNSSLRENLWEQTVQTLRDSQKKLQQEVADARERAAQAEASKWSVETRLAGTLQALEKANEELRELREKLDGEQTESRRNALDRQRFAAYLEEGLAMLGALPPKPLALDEPPLDDLAVNAEALDDSPHHRPTRSYAVTPADLEDDDDEPEMELKTNPSRPSMREAAPIHDEPEADPLPDPTRP